jgi:Holliday junction resolvase RusA-like endonuclease
VNRRTTRFNNCRRLNASSCGTVRLTLAFYLPRPQSLAKRMTAHTKYPDLDKMVRSVNDALTHVVSRDDSRVVDLLAMKRYATDGEPPTYHVQVEPAAGIVPLPVDQPLFALR